ncbi:hypothetical protein IJ843_03440 [bacterium]|nr:hypothetical protein [bacterium]
MSFIFIGIVKTDTSVAIDKKGNAAVTSKLLFDRNLESYMGDVLNPEYYRKNSQDTEMEFNKIYEDGYVGIQSSKNIKNAYKNDLSGLPDYLIPKDKKYLKVNKSVFHKNIKINWTSDFLNMRGTDGRVIDKQTVEMIVPVFRITIPYTASKNNAQNVTNDKHTYEWKLSTANQNEIILEYNVINFFNVVVFVIALILLISAIVLCLTKNKKEIYISLFAISGVLLLYIILFEIVCLISNIPQKSAIEKLLKSATEVTETEETFLIDYSNIPAKKYHFFEDKYFTDILEFKDKGVSVYKFVVETDTSVGNDGSNFSYEIGRIYINSQNTKKSKCTYSYMAKFSDEQVKYFECSEPKFIKSFPKIAKLKKEKFNELKSIIEEQQQSYICSYADMENKPECKKFVNMSEDEWGRLEDLYFSKLEELRSATLKK